MISVSVRLYGGLNGHVDERLRQRSFTLPFAAPPSVDDVLALLGVPSSEVELVLVDGQPAERAARVGDGARLAVYPPLHSLARGA